MVQITISLVLYNCTDFELNTLLSSLDRQTSVSFNLLIFDNSPGPEKVKTGKRNFKIDYYKSPSNVGFGKGHNYNFLRSNYSPYFLVINPDIYFDDPLLLKKIFDRMNENLSIGLSSVRILNSDGSLQEVHRLLPRFSDICRRLIFNKLGIYNSDKHAYTLPQVDKTKDFQCPNIAGSFMMFRSDLYAELKGFDEQLFLYFEDIDLSRRFYFKTNGQNIVFGELIVFHTWKRQGYKSLEIFKIHVLSGVYYFQKYGIFRDEYSKTVNQSIMSLITK